MARDRKAQVVEETAAPQAHSFSEISQVLRDASWLAPIFGKLSKIPEILTAVEAAGTRLDNLARDQAELERQLVDLSARVTARRDEVDRTLAEMGEREAAAKKRAEDAEARAEAIEAEVEDVIQREKDRATKAEVEAGERVLEAHKSATVALRVLEEDYGRRAAVLKAREEEPTAKAEAAEQRLDEIAAVLAAGRR